MINQETKLELILSTESKVLSTNIKSFEEQANQYLSALTKNFETDDDFAKAKKEIKELTELEDKTRTVINNALNGNKDVSELIATAESIAERFRQERLNRTKLVKEKEAEIKSGIVTSAYNEIIEVRQGYESDVSLAIEKNISKTDIKIRLEISTKRKSTLATLTKAVEAEKNLILAELAQESARITSRRKLIPLNYEYLFKDTIALIAGTDDLENIVEQRIAEEKQREEELKAKAEQEARAKAEREAKAKTEQEVETKHRTTATQPQKVQESLTTTEPLGDFVVTIRLNQHTRSQAVEIARRLKATFGDCVSLNKAK